MGRMQREKGKRGEREAAAVITEIFGLEARRTAQRRGDQTADIDCGRQVHIEVKRRAGIAAIRWLEQAERDKTKGTVPFVMLREDKDLEWSILVRASQLKGLMVELERHEDEEVEPLD
tara:strand:- start:182 stop:535 length:354 start_codon:yes stop_codon:yes gene_type:complete